MKKIILLFLALLTTTFGYSSHHHSHHHSSHHSSHHNSHHTTHSNHHDSHSSNHNTHESHSSGYHPYHPVSGINRKNVHYNRSNMTWYYILRNNNTSKNDTIKAETLDELNNAVVSATNEESEDNSIFNDESTLSTSEMCWVLGFPVLAVLIVVIVAYIKSR